MSEVTRNEDSLIRFCSKHEALSVLQVVEIYLRRLNTLKVLQFRCGRTEMWSSHINVILLLENKRELNIYASRSIGR